MMAQMGVVENINLYRHCEMKELSKKDLQKGKKILGKIPLDNTPKNKSTTLCQRPYVGPVKATYPSFVTALPGSM